MKIFMSPMKKEGQSATVAQDQLQNWKSPFQELKDFCSQIQTMNDQKHTSKLSNIIFFTFCYLHIKHHLYKAIEKWFPK